MLNSTTAENSYPWPVLVKEDQKQPEYRVICAPGVIGDIVRADVWFFVNSTYRKEREMIDRIFSPTVEAARFLDEHPVVEPVLLAVAKEAGRFFKAPPDLQLRLFQSWDDGDKSLMGEVRLPSGYDPMTAVHEMSAFDDWFAPLYIQADGLLTIHLVI